MIIPDEQASIYNQIVEVVNKDEGDMFFLYGYGGTGKTYIWKTLASSLRTNNKIVIITIRKYTFNIGYLEHSTSVLKPMLKVTMLKV